MISTLKFKMMMKHILKALLLFIFPFTILAQDDANKLMLAGNVSDYFEENSISGVSVKVTSGGQYVNNVLTDGKGKYEVVLDFEKDFLVLYEKAGYVPKKVIVSTKGVPPQDC